MEGIFVRKPLDWNEVKETTEWARRCGKKPQEITAIATYTFDKAKFDNLVSDFLRDYDFVDKHTDKCTISDKVRSIIVKCKSDNRVIAIDSSGYSYPRYVAIISE